METDGRNVGPIEQRALGPFSIIYHAANCLVWNVNSVANQKFTMAIYATDRLSKRVRTADCDTV